MAKINVTGTEIKTLFNPNFNYTEFGTIKRSAGSNNFVLSADEIINNNQYKIEN